MSLQFDAEYYLAQYADVAAAVNAGAFANAQAHWEQYGAAEGRNPNAIFNTAEYLAANPDVAASGMNPLDHFLQYGAAEGRAPNAAYQPIAAGFDSDAYLAANPDVAAAVQSGAFASAYEHWVEYGQFEDTREATYNGGTPVTGITDPAAGETTDLAKGVESVTGTAGNDTFNGVVSALSSARTLDAGDSIDGGEGSDTLNVDLQTSFAGFSGDGGMTGVETVNLSNEGSIGRNFDASGVEGVEQYTLNGNINLVDVADATAAVAIADRTADLTVDYADKATDGSADALDLSVSNVGTVEDADTTKIERQDVAVNADGIESLNLTTAGDNVLDLSGVNAKAITASGTGTLDTSVAAATKTFDASANEGAVKVDLGNAAAVTAVQTGAGDDTITAATGDLATNAVIDGGDGANTLALSGSGTVQYQMSNVQTLALGDLNSGTLTFSARDTSGLETVAAGSDFSDTATLAGLGTQDMAFDLSGANSNKGTITADNAGVSVVTVSASDSADADTPDTNTTGLKLTQSSAVDLTVGEYVDYQGNITAQKAQSLEVAVAGEINNTIDAGSATGAVFNVTNSADNASSNVTLNAQKLVDLNVTAASDLDMSLSALGALESLTVDTDGIFRISDLGAINAVELSGNGSANLGALGNANNDQYGITVNAEGLNDGLTLGTITTNGTDIDVNAADVQGDVTLNGAVNAGSGDVDLDLANVAGSVTLNAVTGNDVTIDVSNVLNGVTYSGDISVADSVTLNGAELSGNTGVNINASGNDVTATLNGGLAADAYTLNLTNSDLKNVDLNGDLGIGDDSVTLSIAGDSSADNFTADYNITGGEALEVDFASGDTSDVMTLSAGSSLAGYDSVTVRHGTLDISKVTDFTGTKVDIASGITMTASQFAALKTLDIGSANSRVDIAVNSAEEAQQVQQALTTLKVEDSANSDSASNALTIGLQIAQSVASDDAVKGLTTALQASDKVDTLNTVTVDDSGNTSDDGDLVTNVLTVAQAVGRGDALGDDYSIEDTAANLLAVNDSSDATDNDVLSGADSRTVIGTTNQLTIAEYKELTGTDSNTDQLSAKFGDGAKYSIGMGDNDETFAVGSSAEVTNKLTLNGGTGADKLEATLDQAVAFPTYAPTLNGVENISLTSNTAGAGLMMTNATGVGTIINDGSTSDLSVIDVQAPVDLKAVGVNSEFEPLAGTWDSSSNFVVRYRDDAAAPETQHITLNNANLNLLTVTALGENDDGEVVPASAGITTLDITSDGSGDEANSIRTFNEDKGGNPSGLSATLDTVTINGSADLTLIDLPTGITVDGSAATGNLYLVANGTEDSPAESTIITGGSGNDTLFGGDGNDTITGGAGNDVIYGREGADTMTGGEGNDTFVIATNDVTAAGADIVTDFGTGADQLNFKVGETVGANVTEGSSAVGGFQAALDAANTVFADDAATDVAVNAQQVGSDLYVFAETTGDNIADAVVQLVGVNLADFDHNDVATATA
ncbi:hypothetical protein R5R73_05750 [Salinicola sp. LHM]|uniref:beta strand repeat-containing protein n=1 Tax=Salinicola sp. LHM TaxID=3065298 RepID=UPI002ACE1F97|nr:hypothetical protein [Salinicola sp. LHM]WQH34191.1 hypothetical protein R5R73_05750 [Salinicola sp. LHM]